MEREGVYESKELASEELPVFSGKVKHTGTGKVLDIFSERFESVIELEVEGIYEHFKSRPNDLKLYYAHGAVRDTISDEMMVVYESLYGNEPTMSVRPYSIFFDEVEHDGQLMSRFTKLFLPDMPG